MEQLERQGTSSSNGSGVQADLDASPPPQPAERMGGAQVYETPLIEQGSVILGGTQQEFGFALRQQYFHKSVMLLLQHDPTFTRGIMLNRPSAMELDGWRVWFGGDVSEGGLFHGGSPDEAGEAGRREIVCLHSLESAAAARLSMPVIRGVAHTTLEGAKALIEQGDNGRTFLYPLPPFPRTTVSPPPPQPPHGGGSQALHAGDSRRGAYDA
jgi:putative transcriptional regulator